MLMKLWLTVVLASLMVEGAVAQTAPQCRSDPRVVGPCRTVHGRLSAANGRFAYAIWIVGTKHFLGLEESADLPEEVQEGLQREPMDTRLYGDFEVCPLAPERKDSLQPVCLKSASNLVVERINHDGTRSVHRMKSPRRES